MAVNVYKDSDTGAPPSNGIVADVLTWIDKVLLHGYNLTTVTITSSGGVATVTDTAHGRLTDDYVAFVGANEPDYNGAKKITVVDADTYTYAVSNSPASPATGTITARKASVGHLAALTGTPPSGGFVSKTVTITRSGTTATVSSTAHGLTTNDDVTITGSDQADYNGSFTVTVVGANSYTFTVQNSPTSPATGSIVATKSNKGWRGWYADSANKAYKSPNVSGFTRFNAISYYLSVTMYSTMSSATAGTGASSAAYLALSSVATATARAYVVASNGKTVNAFVSNSLTADAASAKTFQFNSFGEFDSIVVGDVSNLFTCLNNGSNASQTNLTWQFVTTTPVNLFVQKSSDNVSTNPSIYYSFNYQYFGYTQASSGPIRASNAYVFNYPDVATGGVLAETISFYDYTAKRERGFIKGAYLCPQNLRSTFGGLAKITGSSGSLAGKVFLLMALNSHATETMLLEISDTW